MTQAQHAIVIGGSIAGMCAARVLCDVFERVTVIDRDTYPQEAQHRKGVPQSRHPHALLNGGRQQLEALFPGFVEKMLEGGALELDPGREMATLRPDGWAEGRATPNTLLFCSRVLIEAVIRKLAAKHPNVRYVENTVVTGLIASENPQRVTGVRTKVDDQAAELTADLVVDASGRGTRITDWLEELGLQAPQQTVVDADSGYSTRWYQGPADAIAHAQPISDVYARRAMQNAWRHYERWSVDLPGFIATGDATCGFNPVYGQGMTSAAFCATVLQRCLKGEDPTSARFARRFFKEQAKFLSVPWLMATSRDRQQAHMTDADGEGKPSRLGLLVRSAATRYLGQLALAAGRDSLVNQRLFDVINLSIQPRALFDPRVIARIAWARFRQKLEPPAAINQETPDYPPAPTGA